MGVFASAFVLFQVIEGDITVDQIASVMHTEAENEEPPSLLFEVAGFTENDDSRVYATFVSPEPKNFAQISFTFEDIASRQNVDQIVVIGENETRRGFKDIAFNRAGALFGEIENDDMGVSDRAFLEEGVLHPIDPLLNEFFPNADVYGVLVKEFADEEDIDELAALLAERMDENSLLILSEQLTEGMEKEVAAFQDEMTMQILESGDRSAVVDANVDGRKALSLLIAYTEAASAQKFELLEHVVTDDSSHLYGHFYAGEAIDDRSLTIMASGDMMLGRYVRTLMNQNGLDYIFRDIQGPEMRFFSGADVIFGNLEGPIRGEGKSGGTSMNFAFNRDIGPLLARYNFNLMSIANNHAMDAGTAGRDETIEVLEENGIGWCGHELEVDPGSVHYGKVGDHRYAFLCFSDINFPLDDEAAQKLIAEVRPNVDYLVVSVHWGPEYYHSPHQSLQVSPGRAFIDAGADFVIGHHPHVVQTFEEYNGKLIFYSLGNFVFDQYWSQKTQEGLAIGIVLDDGDGDALSTKVHLFPMKSEASQSYLMTGDLRASYLEKFIGYGDYSEEMKAMIREGVVVVD